MGYVANQRICFVLYRIFLPLSLLAGMCSSYSITTILWLFLDKNQGERAPENTLTHTVSALSVLVH